MFPDWILTIIKESGAAGAIIFVLCGIIVLQYRTNEKMNTKRFDEREALMKLTRDTAEAIKENSKATEERNEVTQELADALAKLSATSERFSDKIEMQTEMIKDKLNGQAMAIDAMAGAIRALDGVATEIRNYLHQQLPLTARRPTR